MTTPMKIRRRSLLAGLGAGIALGVMPSSSVADEPSGRSAVFHRHARVRADSPRTP
jgi:hypothetical protein